MSYSTFSITIVLLTVLTIVQSQNITYYCNFDTNGIDDCQFTLASTGTNALTITSATTPLSKPTQPLSDVTSIESPTTPNNERCLFPYPFPPNNWDMYFCRRFSNGSFTCPTASGSGQCSTGRFANIRVPFGTNPFNQTYSVKVQTNSPTTQCLDFYYYMTDPSSNAKIQVGWKVGVDEEQIVEVTPKPENKWHRSRSSFVGPQSPDFDLTIRFIRIGTGGTFFFSFDEIKIVDGPCSDVVITETTTVSATITANDITSVAVAEVSNSESMTVSMLPDTTTSDLTIAIDEETTSTSRTTVSVLSEVTPPDLITAASAIDQETTSASATTVNSQNINYYCNFDTNGIDDCKFTLASTGTNALTITSTSIPTTKPTQPLSDVTSVESPTTPNNETCLFPYPFPPSNWDMYFCRRFSNGSFTCPTASGSGQCSTGRFANIRVPFGTNPFNQTYSVKVQRNSLTTQCLDFYYYMTDPSNNAKIQVGWKVGVDEEQIVEVTPKPENKWHRSRTSFVGPQSSDYDLTFRFIRITTGGTFFFSFDEIRIVNAPCRDVATTETTMVSTTTAISSTTSIIVAEVSSSKAPVVSLLPGSTNEERTEATTSKEIPITSNSVFTSSSTVITSNTTEDTTNPPNLGLILGLSIGLGGTALITLIGSSIYYVKVVKPKGKVRTKSALNSNEIPMTPTDPTNDSNMTTST